MSVFKNVVGWLGGAREPSPEPCLVGDNLHQDVEDKQTHESQPVVASGPANLETTGAFVSDTVASDNINDEARQPKDKKLDVDLQEVSEKAISAAKEFGSYLFSFGKTATEQVAKTAMQLKETVEEKTIIGDFSREQNKFVAEQHEKKKMSEAAVPPWVGYNEEDVMKTQILALSKDKRNLLRNPPAGVPFHFDYDVVYPTALVMLEEDPRLKAVRFELVPKQINEETFWRNFFYRVSLIKQSTQLTSLAQMTGSSYESSKMASKVASKEKILPGSAKSVSEPEKELEDLTPSENQTDHEFVSDSFQSRLITDEDLVNELNQLGVSENSEKNSENIPDWEKQLQDELQNELDSPDETDDLEREILKQIEAESKQT